LAKQKLNAVAPSGSSLYERTRKLRSRRRIAHDQVLERAIKSGHVRREQFGDIDRFAEACVLGCFGAERRRAKNGAEISRVGRLRIATDRREQRDPRIQTRPEREARLELRIERALADRRLRRGRATRVLQSRLPT
jgi:hypothetical protein